MKKLFFTFLIIGSIAYYTVQNGVRLDDFTKPKRLLAKLITSNQDLFFEPSDLKCTESCVVLTQDYDLEKIKLELHNLYKVPVTVKLNLHLTQAKSEKGEEFVLTLGPEQKRKVITHIYPQNGVSDAQIDYDMLLNYGKRTGEYKNEYVYHPPILKGREAEVLAGHFSRNKPHAFLLKLKMRAGEVVQVSRPGVVVDIQKNKDSKAWQPAAFREFIPYVVVQHDDGTLALYGNIQLRDLVTLGKSLPKGQNIGEVGSSGEFYFEVFRINDQAEVDSFPALIDNDEGSPFTSVMTGQVLKR